MKPIPVTGTMLIQRADEMTVTLSGNYTPSADRDKGDEPLIEDIKSYDQQANVVDLTEAEEDEASDRLFEAAAADAAARFDDARERRQNREEDDR